MSTEEKTQEVIVNVIFNLSTLAQFISDKLRQCK